MKKIRLIVLDDYDGELAAAPAMAKLQAFAEVTVFDRPLAPSDLEDLKNYQILMALRERTRLDDRFFAACTSLELVLQTGGHAYHLDKAAANRRGIIVALGRRVSGPMVVIPELTFGLILDLIRGSTSLPLSPCPHPAP